MYVIFPAEDVVEFTIARPPQPRFQHCSCHCIALQKKAASAQSVISSAIKRSTAVDQACSAILSADINGNTNTNTNTNTDSNTNTNTSINIDINTGSGAGAGAVSSVGANTKANSNFVDSFSVVKPEKKAKHRKANAKSNSEKNVTITLPKMSAANLNEASLKELSHPSFNEQLKAYNTATFKLAKTVSDFSQDLSRAYEEHATNLQQIVTNHRKKNTELRKERPSCQSSLFHVWESLLQEVEVDSQAQGDIANVFTRQVSRPLLDRSFHRKVQARKIFGHRDSFEIIINKAEEKLAKCRQEYKAAYLAHLSSPNSSTTLSNYIEAHNSYVRQLHATNGMVEQYSKETLPALLQELEDVYSDLCSTVSDSVLQGAETITSKSAERIKRYENISVLCRSILPNTDVAYFIKYLSPLPNQPHPSHRLRVFVHPLPPQNAATAVAAGTGTGTVTVTDQDNATISNSDYSSNAEHLAQLLPKNELVTDYLSANEIRDKHDTLKADAVKLEAQIKQLQDSLDTLLRIQQRSLESSLFNKVNELQEDISIKRYDLRIAQIQLAAVRAQKELFSVKMDNLEHNSRDRKLSAISNASMKSKWLKAFKSLKTSVPSNGSSAKETEKKSGRDGIQVTSSPDFIHQFQEYTYKKITPCDVCSQVLRGHTRQGLKCRLCKMNVHLDCQEKVTTRCQTKSRLLRRQKSTSEIETRIIAAMPEEEGRDRDRDLEEDTSTTNDEIVDYTYQVIKQANEIKCMPPPLPQPLPLPLPPASSTSAGVAATEAASAARISAPAEPPRKTHHAAATVTMRAGGVGASLNVVTPPVAFSSDYGWMNTNEVNRQPVVVTETTRKRRLFGGVRSFTVFGGGRSQGRSTSLPETPHSPRRHKINWRMKSVSLDSSDPPDFCQPKCSVVGSAASVEPYSNHSSSSRLQSPSSPVHNRRLLSARPMRMSSVELPDDSEKSPSSASNSPIPSPMKPQRLLPTNLYVVLYNFKARHSDELDLKAGYKVTVIDTSDHDWWKGKCLGRIGFFPSKYVTRLQSGERVLQVTHNLQVSAADNADKGITLLRDQIVIQVGEDIDGMIMFRNGDNQQGVCPLEFLQEV